MTYQVKLSVFEGPMDLLLHLIEKNEVDIYNIPVALITQQYLDYLAAAQEVDLEVTSEFLLMACTLLALKARMLLPRPVVLPAGEEEEDPRQELVEKLLEYKTFKEKAHLLKELEMEQSRIYWRKVDEVVLLKQFPPRNPLGTVTMEDLWKTYVKVLKRVEKKREVLSITREGITIQERMVQVLEQLAQKPYGLSFLQLLEESVLSRERIIVTFLAILELTRQGLIRLRQSQPFSEITIFLQEVEGGLNVAHPVSR